MQQVGIGFIDFGFGPAGKAVVLAKQLLKRRCQVHVVGHVRAHPLFSDLRRAFPGFLHVRQQLPSRVASQLDAFVSVLDDGVEKKQFRPGIKVFYVDSLCWMWNRIPKAFLSGDAYFAQNFFGVPGRIETLRSQGVGPAFVVGPIVDPQDVSQREADREPSIVLTFGGLSDPITPKEEQVRVVKWILSGLRRSLEAVQVIVCVPNDLRELLDPSTILPTWVLCQLPHEAFLRSVQEATAVIGLPGLTTILECAAAGTPFLPLIPNNYSQALILGAGVGAQMFPETAAYRELASSGASAAGQDELTAVQRVKTALRELQAYDPDASFCDEYAGLLAPSLLDRFAARQTEWFGELGPNGAIAIASCITSGGQDIANIVGDSCAK